MREDDREYLVRQMVNLEPRQGVACSVMPAQVALKKENERLKKESERLNKTALAQKNHSESKSNKRIPEQEAQQQPPVSKVVCSHVSICECHLQSEQDELARYKEVYKRLKKMLENERKSGREVSFLDHLDRPLTRARPRQVMRRCSTIGQSSRASCGVVLTL